MSFPWTEHIALVSPHETTLFTRERPYARWRRQRRAGLPLPTLAELLDGERGRLTLLLGAGLALPLVLPWQGGLESREEWNAYAALTLAERFGRSADAWRASCSLGAYGEACPAAGVDAAFWDGLQTWLAGTRLKLVSAKPLLSAVADRYARQLAPGAALLIVEAHAMQMLNLKDGRWQQALVLPRAAGDTLAQSLFNAVMLTGLADEPALVLADPREAVLPASALGWVHPCWSDADEA
ncbi:hypothetical protein [Crenobacter cavernae]|uniref:Uncharacterized protein n=1 Tax=Crenobacter cavernae TaxID=2290923 RepID=A0ABY0FBR3_9NEIS|nr:hypothetical protein [Crenobacter cavernae]RXZ43212.1 hypothetical protein EBB06_10620 [Crenobacter cavernae]